MVAFIQRYSTLLGRLTALASAKKKKEKQTNNNNNNNKNGMVTRCLKVRDINITKGTHTHKINKYIYIKSPDGPVSNHFVVQTPPEAFLHVSGECFSAALMLQCHADGAKMFH